MGHLKREKRKVNSKGSEVHRSIHWKDINRQLLESNELNVTQKRAFFNCLVMKNYKFSLYLLRLSHI